MPMPSRVEVLSWDVNKVGDLLREQRLVDCIDCVFQRHIDGQKLLNLKEGDVLYFLEIHNEKSRKKFWDLIKKITEKKSGVHNLMRSFEQSNNKNDVEDEKDNEEEFDDESDDEDSFGSNDDSDNEYDLPYDSDLPEKSLEPTVTVERRETIRKSLMNMIKPEPQPKTDPDLNSPYPDDIYDVPEDGFGDPEEEYSEDEDTYDTPEDSGGGVVKRMDHTKLAQQFSGQYVIPNAPQQSEEYEVPGQDEPTGYVLPESATSETILPPRPPKKMSNETPSSQKRPPFNESHEDAKKTNGNWKLPKPGKIPEPKPVSQPPWVKPPVPNVKNKKQNGPPPPPIKIQRNDSLVEGENYEMPEPQRVLEPKKSQSNQRQRSSQSPQPPRKPKPAVPSFEQTSSQSPQPPRKPKPAVPSFEQTSSQSPQPPRKPKPAVPSFEQTSSQSPQPPRKPKPAVPSFEQENYELPDLQREPKKVQDNQHQSSSESPPQPTRRPKPCVPVIVEQENYELPELQREPPKKSKKNQQKTSYQPPQPPRKPKPVEPTFEQENYELPELQRELPTPPNNDEQQENYEIPDRDQVESDNEPEEDYEVPESESGSNKPSHKKDPFGFLHKLTGGHGKKEITPEKKSSSLEKKESLDRKKRFSFLNKHPSFHSHDVSDNAEKSQPKTSSAPQLHETLTPPALPKSKPPSSPALRQLPQIPDRPDGNNTQSDQPSGPPAPPPKQPKASPKASPRTGFSGKQPPPIPSFTGINNSSKGSGSSMQKQPWFHGKVSKDVYIEMLKNANQDGAFLVRESSKNSALHVLSVYYHTDIRHLEMPREKGQYRLGKSGKLKFDSIVELVEHFKKHDIEFSAGGQTRLTHACFKTS